jgi:hypothetical protein
MTQENLALEEFFFFKSHQHEYARHVLIENEQLQYKKRRKKNNNLTKEATTKPLPPINLESSG